MDAGELAQIVREEALDAPVIDGAGRLHQDAVVLDRDGARWRVYLVDERHQVIEPTLRFFDSESDALEHVLRKLRQVKDAQRAMEAMRARRAADRGSAASL